MLTAIINARLIIGNDIFDNKVVIFDNKIVDIVNSDKIDEYKECSIIDAKGAYLSSGFIDIHIHGSGDADTMDSTFEALETISTTITQTGTTAFLATTMTMSSDSIDKALQNIRLNGVKVSGASIVGVHMEGPFINPDMCGAQDTKHIQAPSLELIDKYSDIVRMITLAPEVAGGIEFVKNLNKKYPQIVLSIGHSNASYEGAIDGFNAGISHATHLGNAMSGFHHRSPGVVGAVLNNDISCDVIADTIHTHTATLELFWKVKKEKLLLITDSMRAGCMKCGTYSLGGQNVTVSSGEARLDNGQLAGSVLRLNHALKNMTMHTSMSICDAIYSVTEGPAKKLALATKGSIIKGFDADMVLFDYEFNIHKTIVNGVVVYSS
jgi:N-acetylglucosamine-6-phosphate deacetylase